MTAESIYHLVAEGELFAEDAKAVQALADFSIGPSRELFRFMAFQYMVDMAGVLNAVYPEVLARSSAPAAKVAFPQCIYCLSTSHSFRSEDHVLPESVAGETIVLPLGAVCDICNNETLSGLDRALIDFPPVSFLRVIFLPHTKEGKYPVARFPSFRVERIGPRSIRLRVFGRDPVSRDAEGHLNVSWTAGRPDLQKLARAIMRVGLGVLAHDCGVKRACAPDFDRARSFIRGATGFPGTLILDTQVSPKGAVQLVIHDTPERTAFAASLFGVSMGVTLQGSSPELPPGAPESLFVLDLRAPGENE